MPISRGEGIRGWTWTPRVLGFEGKLKCPWSFKNLFRILDSRWISIQFQDSISISSKRCHFFKTEGVSQIPFDISSSTCETQKRQDLSQAEDAFTGIIRRSVGLMSRDMGLLQRVARCFHLGLFSWDRRRRHFWKKTISWTEFSNERAKTLL